jgi:hypothetical protein
MHVQVQVQDQAPTHVQVHQWQQDRTLKVHQWH